jgi:ribosomal protein L40E
MIGFPIFVIIVVVVVMLLVATASQSRRHAAKTDPRLCRHCGTSHPSFAQFCRRCGKKL